MAVAALALCLAAGCTRVPETAPEVPPAPPPSLPAGATDLDLALALLDRGDVPGALEPLRRAASAPAKDAALPRGEVDLLLAQAEAAAKPETAEQRIAEMKTEAFEAFVERGTLTRIPYFHDPRIDDYFRKVLLSKRPEAREIRERLRSKP
jgi:hypothetical protein